MLSLTLSLLAVLIAIMFVTTAVSSFANLLRENHACRVAMKSGVRWDPR